MADGGGHSARLAAFMGSPIPKDPALAAYERQMSASFSDADMEDVSASATSSVEQQKEQSETVRGQSEGEFREMEVEFRDDGANEVTREAPEKEERLVKRQRVEIESVATSKNEELKRELEALRIQMQASSERHDLAIKERDQKINQLRRQLEYAVAEEEGTLKELKAATNEHAAEKLALQKREVELEAQLELVEANLEEWKEKALDSSAQLRSVMRQSNMKIQLLQDEVRSLKASAKSKDSIKADSTADAKIRLLESELQQKTIEAEHAESKLLGAEETVQESLDVRSLNAKIAELESNERKLKVELVGLIEASRTASILREKLHQSNLKLKASEEKNAQLQKRVEMALVIEEQNKQFFEYFEPVVSESNGNVSLEELRSRPAAAVMKLYTARQNAFEVLFEQKGNVEIQLRRLEKHHEKLQSDVVTSGNQCARLEVQVAEVQQKLNGASSVVAHLRKVNEELVQILATYEKDSDDQSTSDESSKRIALLESALKQSDALVKELDVSQKSMATPAAVKKYEARIEKLEKALSDAKQENAKQAKLLEKAEMEVAVFEKRLGRGEFNVETTKVVHLAVNPTRELIQSRQAAGEVDALRKENESLRAKLEKLTGESDETAPNSASEPKLTTTASYETVDGLKLLNKRLKEVFSDQIQQYREAIYLLTGYKVDLKKSNGVELLRLRSVYADHDNDELLVRMEPNGALDLLDTDFCGQINQRVFAYLTTCRSFPAFLATLTLHLFEKQTFQG